MFKITDENNSDIIVGLGKNPQNNIIQKNDDGAIILLFFYPFSGYACSKEAVNEQNTLCGIHL